MTFTKIFRLIDKLMRIKYEGSNGLVRFAKNVWLKLFSFCFKIASRLIQHILLFNLSSTFSIPRLSILCEVVLLSK
jgi:hypothetical protein